MYYQKTAAICMVMVFLIFFSGCYTDYTLLNLENSLGTELDKYAEDMDFVFAVEAQNGQTFIQYGGDDGPLTYYRSSSTSKLVAAVIILSLVQDGVLSLDDHPQDYIPGWPDTGTLGSIELRHLLDLTSGLMISPACLNRESADFEACVMTIAEVNKRGPVPGEKFFYNSSHFQVAGLMAVKASGQSTWQEVFNRFKSDSGLFQTSVFDLPSETNPRVAGGMHWTAAEYLAFLEALYNGKILNKDLINQMTSDQISDAVIVYSPILESGGEDWHYGFGCWIECHANPYDCDQTTRISSPGFKGSYPFIDYENHYFGIIASNGDLGIITNGYYILERISSVLEYWAYLNLD